MNLIKQCATAALLLVANAGLVRGAAVLDQSSLAGASRGTTFVGTTAGNTPGDRSQTFVVGITGQLTAVEMQLEASGSTAPPLLLDVRPTDTFGRPLADNSSVLASQSIEAVDLPGSGFALFDLSSDGLLVTAGDRLAIVLRSMANSTSDYGAIGASSNPYPAGSGFFRRGFTEEDWQSSVTANFDLAFRTYVIPVPEPSALLLSATALLGTAFRRGRRWPALPSP